MTDTLLSALWDRPVLTLLVLLALTGLASLAYIKTSKRARRQERKVRVGKAIRRYIVRLPANLPSRDDWRVLIVYHPALSNGEFMERVTRLHDLPESENFIVVYPIGIAKTWNAGTCCGIAKKRQVDDLGFFDAILADLGRVAKIRRKVYVTGYSNGALMTYHLISNRPDRIAAAVPFAAYLPPRDLKDGRPGAVPVLHLHGDQDKGAPVTGGMTNYLGELPPVTQTIKAIARRNGCDPTPRKVAMPELDSVCLQYTGATPEAEASLCIIPGLGHIWPGSEAPKGRFGPGRPDLNGSQVVLDFFMNH